MSWIAKVAVVLSAFLGAVGVDSSAQTIVEPTDEARYELLLASLDQKYLEGDAAAVRALLEEVEALRVNEIPTYERLFYRAALLAQDDHGSAALDALDDFGMMLEIDAGNAWCLQRPEVRIRDAVLVNAQVYDEMCAEMFLQYYGQENERIGGRIEHFRDRSRELRARILAEGLH